MNMKKCVLCGKNIEETFLDKLKGTIVKIKKGNKNVFYYVCSSCQEKYKDNVKKEVEKIVNS